MKMPVINYIYFILGNIEIIKNLNFGQLLVNVYNTFAYNCAVCSHIMQVFNSLLTVIKWLLDFKIFDKILKFN